jgi:adenine-specific DNA-methyltransferase
MKTNKLNINFHYKELIEAYRSNVSHPFEVADNGRIALKIVDDRDIEGLKIVEVE